MVRDFSKASTDNHFIDAQIDPKRANEDVTPIIAVSWLPALELAGEMRHLENSGHRVVGVVFGVYSPLCHLSILLREWGVPAIVNPDIFTMDNIEGAWAGITATESNGSLYIKRLS